MSARMSGRREVSHALSTCANPQKPNRPELSGRSRKKQPAVRPLAQDPVTPWIVFVAGSFFSFVGVGWGSTERREEGGDGGRKGGECLTTRSLLFWICFARGNSSTSMRYVRWKTFSVGIAEGR